MNLIDLIKNNYCHFDSYRAGFLYYKIHYDRGFGGGVQGPSEVVETYQFTIPIDDVGNATLNFKEKAITLMRWIRKAHESNQLIKLPNKTI